MSLLCIGWFVKRMGRKEKVLYHLYYAYRNTYCEILRNFSSLIFHLIVNIQMNKLIKIWIQFMPPNSKISTAIKHKKQFLKSNSCIPNTKMFPFKKIVFLIKLYAPRLSDIFIVIIKQQITQNRVVNYFTTLANVHYFKISL